jgi:hypothetical protein
MFWLCNPIAEVKEVVIELSDLLEAKQQRAQPEGKGYRRGWG